MRLDGKEIRLPSTSRSFSNLTSGTFRLTFDGQVAAPIAYNASAATVESTLEALQPIDNVTVTGSSVSFRDVVDNDRKAFLVTNQGITAGTLRT